MWWLLGIVLGFLAGFLLAAILAASGRASAVEEAVAEAVAASGETFKLGRDLGHGEGYNKAMREVRAVRTLAGVKAWVTRRGE